MKALCEYPESSRAEFGYIVGYSKFGKNELRHLPGDRPWFTYDAALKDFDDKVKFFDGAMDVKILMMSIKDCGQKIIKMYSDQLSPAEYDRRRWGFYHIKFEVGE
jgi:hypothetical protein